MRILVAASNRSIVGGVETYLQSFIAASTKRGHDLALLYQYPSGEGETVDPPREKIRLWHWQDVQNDPAGQKDILDWKPEIVYSHCPDSPEMESWLLANYCCIVYAHNYWGTCATGQKCHAFPHARPCERKLGPMCLVLHYPRRCGGLNPLTAWKMFQMNTLRNARLNQYRKILVASTHMYREYERHGFGPEKLQLIPYPLTDPGLESEPFAPKTLDGLLLYAGRLTELKGVDYLIRAVPQAAQRLGRSLTLTVMGDGPDRARLQKLSEQLGGVADFPGWLSSHRKLAVMRRSDLLVLPSLWPEPFSLVGIEAGCLSVPAVGYAVGGIPDWLIPRRNGELAPTDPPTVSGLVEAIVTALRDSSYYAQLRRGAWETSRQFTMNRHLNQLEMIIHQAQRSEVTARVASAAP